MQSLISHWWRDFCRCGFLNSFYSQRWFPEKYISFFPFRQLADSSKTTDVVSNIEVRCFRENALKLTSAPILSSLSESVALYL